MTAPLPYGLRDVKLTGFTDSSGTTLATPSIDLPNSRTLSFTESEDFTDLRGDDKLVASHGSGAQVAWDLESGGLPFEAFQLMAGGTVTTTGTGATTKTVFAKKTTDARPYFRIEGQAISDSGGDVHVVIPRAKATGDLSGELGDGAFWLTAASGIAIAPSSGTYADQVYSFVYNATVTPFVEPTA